MTEPNQAIPPAMGDNVRDLTDEEYDATYTDGDGGHKLPEHILEQLNGHDDPEAVPPR
jgi:hypothetical protein